MLLLEEIWAQSGFIRQDVKVLCPSLSQAAAMKLLYLWIVLSKEATLRLLLDAGVL